MRPKTCPIFKNLPAPLCVSWRSQNFFNARHKYVQYITAVLLSYVKKSGQDEAFHMAISISLQQQLYKENSLAKCGLFSNQSRY